MSHFNHYEERELLALVAQGDERAFGKLFENYRDRIYSRAFKLSHTTLLAEEIVQDVFMKIWLKRKNLTEIQNFQAYLFIVTRNNVYRVLKRTARNYKVTMLSEDDIPLQHNNTDDYLMEKECSLLLQNAIDRLPARQKQVYKLIKIQQLKREEVASILNLRPDTVKFHLAQAMKNIRVFCLSYSRLLVGISLFLVRLFRGN